MPRAADEQVSCRGLESADSVVAGYEEELEGAIATEPMRMGLVESTAKQNLRCVISSEVMVVVVLNQSVGVPLFVVVVHSARKSGSRSPHADDRFMIMELPLQGRDRHTRNLQQR